MNIEYTRDLSLISEESLSGGFFVGWPNPPDNSAFLRILQNSYCAFVAINPQNSRVIGFINAVSDGVLAAYIPLLEVLPEEQGKGIGSELMRLMLEYLKDFYMVDIVHDESLSPFYAKFGFLASRASLIRNYKAQSGIVVS